MRILLVEDDADQLLLRAMLLRQNGFDVSEANSYAAAIHTANALAFQCAVIDLRLPSEADGIRLLVDLKKVSPRLIVYVLTGSPPGGAFRSSPYLALAENVFAKGSSVAPLLHALKALQSSRYDV